MGDDDKKNQWADSLAEAGLLDEIEDGWTIPGEIKPGLVIKVEGKAGRSREVEHSTEPDLKAVPFAVPYPSDAPAPATPAEYGAEPTGDANDPSETATPIDKDYPAPFRRTSYPPIQDMSDSCTDSIPRFRGTLGSGVGEEKKVRSTFGFEEEKATPKPISVIRIGGRTISVIPEIQELDTEAEICDEPPVLGNPAAILEAISECRDPLAEMREHYEMGNFSGVVEMANEFLKKDPDNEEAIALKKSSEETLMKMYQSRMGSFTRVPEMAISQDQIIWRNLDPSSGFILSRIDGNLTFEDVLDISGMSRFDTCRILNQLLQDGIIK